MKKALLSLTLAILFLFNFSSEVKAQVCVPDTITYPQNGVWPDTLTGLDSGIQCVPYTQVITLNVPADTSVLGQDFWIDSIVVNSLLGLPAGLTFTCEPPSCGFLGNTSGCILVSGTPLTAGIYSIEAYSTAYVTHKTFGTPFVQSDTITYGKMVVDTSLFLSATIVDATCDGVCDGSVMVTPTGGNTPYTYAWNDPGSQNTQMATGLCAGTYEVTVTEGTGCYSIDIVTVANTALLVTTITTLNDSCGTNDGSASASTGGGNSPYTFVWSTGDTSSVASGLGVGTYTVTVTDAIGCADLGSTSVTANDSLSLTYMSTFTSCGDSTGSVTVNVSNGTSPYTYLWSTGASTTSISGLSSGGYNITITDAIGCMDSLLTVVSDTGGLSVTLVSATMVSCNAACDGAATIDTAGAVGPVSYSWNTTPAQTTAMATNLCAGTHVVTVNDSICTAFLNVNITQAPAIVISSELAVDPLCNGNVNDSIIIVANGGAGSLSYSIDSGSTYVGSGVFVNPGAGTYDVVVMDDSGCVVLGSTLTITMPPAVSIDSEIAMDISCFESADGSIVITASGGTGAFEYSLDGGANYNNTSGSFTDLGPGPTVIAVWDANKCQLVGSTIIINEPPALSISTSSTMESTAGALDGTASVIANGGTGAYTYTWSISPSQDSATATGLAMGDYFVTVTDANGCTIMSDTVAVGLGIGIRDIVSQLTVELYPNPAQEELTVLINLTYDFTLMAYDVRGKHILSVEMRDGKNNISLANLSGGLYVYHILDSSGAVLYHGKFNVMH